jgi:phenylpyruvate tautomerase PptA (4-oxalocrotonate tautomerase family)
VSLFSGRTQRDKDRLAESITESVCKILGVSEIEVKRISVDMNTKFILVPGQN